MLSNSINCANDGWFRQSDNTHEAMEMVLDANDIVFFINLRTVISPKESESPVSEFNV